ncbi:Importin N-terminal domain-containing protein [Aphelenchoides besseyi]|nr:Importin N-terminal domain-containing protein [Aphelenchoides besseyi]KAI6236562.1 Importin N-terminal domain-containing protein [Aphelenchoides besseyi]
MVTSSSAIQIIEQARTALDPASEKIDVDILDQVVMIMNKGAGQQQRDASELLSAFKVDLRAWTKVDAILEFSKCVETKYFGLQILEELIQTRWRSLPRDQCEGIKGYIVGKILDISKAECENDGQKLLLQKLNLVLVQIVKFEWPRHWPTFIMDIVGSSRNSQWICTNNMEILRLLSEEVFDFETNLTSSKAAYLKQEFCGQFQAVHALCLEILQSAENVDLIYKTLRTLHGFLSWVPVGFIFENNLIELITGRFLPFPNFRALCVQCLVEISTIDIDNEPKYGQRLDLMFKKVVEVLAEQLPLELDIAKSFAIGRNEEQQLISNLAQFFSAYLKKHANICEVLEANPEVNRSETRRAHELALKYMLKISEVEDMEIFKICMDYWNWLTSELFRESPFSETQINFSDSIRRLRENSNDLPRRRLYSPFLSELRMLMISRMAKPEEVIVVVNENNEAVRELVKDTDSIVLYKTMRETLVFLTHLDYRDTEMKMIEKLQNQVNGTEWSWKNLNTLCWAIGSISGAMHEEDERRFLVTVIRDLLGLCEQKRGKNNKAVIASNIMYVVGQYPRFLRAHWRFLKTVINKLFEFAHESHEGVQDMACDTFIKIVMKCKSHFTMTQIGESQPFVEEILLNLSTIICDLSEPQVHVFYEAMGHIISSEHDEAAQTKLIESLMVVPNRVWSEIIEHATQDTNIILEPEVLKNLVHILKTNVSACKSIGIPFYTQIQRIFEDMIAMYRLISSSTTNLVNEQGQEVLKQPLVKQMRTVKREILTVLSTWIARAEPTLVAPRDSQRKLVEVQEAMAGVVIPALFDTILQDYAMSVPEAREPKVLSLLSITITSLKEKFSNHLQRMFELVFLPTLEMIKADTSFFPEHRVNFFQMLDAAVRSCFDQEIMGLPEEMVNLVIQAILWAFRHTIRSVAEIGIQLVVEILVRLRDSNIPLNTQQAFYQRYFMQILTHVIGAVTDHNQVPFVGLGNLSDAICQLFHCIETDIQIPLDATRTADKNSEFIFDTLGRILSEHFPNLTPDQVRVTIKGFFSYNQNTSKMRDHIRDFLVQIREQAGTDTADLFLEEKEKELQRLQAEKAFVPGIQNPHEIADDDMAS